MTTAIARKGVQDGAKIAALAARAAARPTYAAAWGRPARVAAAQTLRKAA